MVEIVFITSSTEKLDHARYLCRKYAVVVSKQKNYGVGYVEPRIDDRETLLQESIEDAIRRSHKTVSNSGKKFFFIEDTSVIINALSKEKEFPGVDVKYWMKENDFSSVDKVLKDHGNDRSVTVRSDVILVIPQELQNKLKVKYMVFTSQTEGSIIEQEVKVQTQPLYPWLSSKTFNKWFVPKGANKPISLLPIEEADKYDFRADAFKRMLEFLREHGSIKTKEEYNTDGSQLKLFEPFCFIICGPTCAGKSTLANYLTEKYKYFHIEASDYMYLSYFQKHGTSLSVSVSDFAEEVLKENPTIVSNQILTDIDKLKLTPIIITGFRSPKEIESIKKMYNGGLYVESVYIDADIEKRFERCVLRGRQDSQKTMQNFTQKDDQQLNMGLSLIKEDHKSSIILNNGTIDEFFNAFEAAYRKQFDSVENFNQTSSLAGINLNSLQNAIILTLTDFADQTKFHTTTEISHLIKENPAYGDNPKHKDNISRYFHQHFHPYFEIHSKEGKTSYRLSQTGKAFGQWLKRHKPKKTGKKKKPNKMDLD